jgi:hypothetical protein
MTGAITVIADHGELVSAIPFVLPAFLVIGVLLVMRAAERRRNTRPE